MKLLAVLLTAYCTISAIDAHASVSDGCEVATAAYNQCLKSGGIAGTRMDEQECWENTVGVTDDCIADDEEEDFSDSGVGCIDDCLDSALPLEQQ